MLSPLSGLGRLRSSSIRIMYGNEPEAPARGESSTRRKAHHCVGLQERKYKSPGKDALEDEKISLHLAIPFYRRSLLSQPPVILFVFVQAF